MLRKKIDSKLADSKNIPLLSGKALDTVYVISVSISFECTCLKLFDFQMPPVRINIKACEIE